jgi:hypothetical protein
MTPTIWCPNCKRRVIQLGTDGAVKIRTKIVVFKGIGGHATIVCQHCGGDVDVDMTLGSLTVRMLQAPRLVIRPAKFS